MAKLWPSYAHFCRVHPLHVQNWAVSIIWTWCHLQNSLTQARPIIISNPHAWTATVFVEHPSQPVAAGTSKIVRIMDIVSKPGTKSVVWEYFGTEKLENGGIADDSKAICRSCRRSRTYWLTSRFTTPIYSLKSLQLWKAVSHEKL